MFVLKSLVPASQKDRIKKFLQRRVWGFDDAAFTFSTAGEDKILDYLFFFNKIDWSAYRPVVIMLESQLLSLKKHPVTRWFATWKITATNSSRKPRTS